MLIFEQGILQEFSRWYSKLQNPDSLVANVVLVLNKAEINGKTHNKPLLYVIH